MFNPNEFSEYQWLIVPFIIFGRYFVTCLILYALFYLWKRRAMLYRKIQQRFPKDADLRREIGYSALTSVIFAVVVWLCLGTPFRAFTQFYANVHQHSLLYLVLSIPLTLFIHDAYFYWIHRFMHWPAMYRLVHLTHHKSVNPSPWAAYAFHPAEALLEAGIIPLLLLIMPLHPISFFGFITLMLLFNVYGHLGYELFPRKVYEHPIGRWLNSSVYHNQHHERFHGNYSLYFTIWDRLMGTLRADSVDKIEEIHHRINVQIFENQSKTKYFMSNKTLYFLLLSSLAATVAPAQTVNWATDVAPILYDNCVKCHRDGGIGHFSLIGYENAYEKRFSIQNQTELKQMPPWKPDPNYRHYAGETLLSEGQIQTIKTWVENDAPAGDLSQAPPNPVFNLGSDVGDPDHVLVTPFYTVTATEDEYRCFVIPNGLTQNAFLRGLEAIPGNHEVVHHILIYEDVSGQGEVLDAQTPEPGYVNFGGSGVAGARLIGAWVPGSRTKLMPPFMGVKLTAGADLIVQMHYPAGTTGMSDMTTLNFFFTPGNQGIREVFLDPLLNHVAPSLQNGPLLILPNAVKTFHAKFTVPQNGSLIAVAPHMHLIGRSIKSFAVSPQGDTIPLINIPDWDFHWQGAYTFQKVQKIPTGYVLHAYAAYDNTPENPHQPSNPPKLVTLGEATTDEMLLVYFTYMAYLPGDENIVLDSTLLSSSVAYGPENSPLATLQVFPNPAHDQLAIAFDVAQTSDIRASILDLSGRIIKIVVHKRALTPGAYQEHTDVQDLPPGVYVVEMQAGTNAVLATKFVKQ